LPKSLQGLLDNNKFWPIFNDSLDRDVDALAQFLVDNHKFQRRSKADLADGNPERYLDGLRRETSQLDVRGIRVGQERAQSFDIEQLFITLTTSSLPLQKPDDEPVSPPKNKGRKRSSTRKSKAVDPLRELFHRQPVPLEQALRNQRLLIIGDPGAGKTTFLKHLVQIHCRRELRQEPSDSTPPLDPTFPLLVRIGEFSTHLLKESAVAGAPTTNAPAWLPHFLAKQSADNNWGLSQHDFNQRLQSEQVTLFFDGLDEAPDQRLRERVQKIIDAVAHTYKTCRLVVTSRPLANSGTIDLDQFTVVQIDPLSDEAVERFVDRWCLAVFPKEEQEGKRHYRELLGALRARPEIRRMARTPVMLTALAVVHWGRKRLPEQRAELYECVLRWLTEAKQDKPGRESPLRVFDLLRELALGMQLHPAGVQRQVTLREGAELIAGEFRKGPKEVSEKDAIAAAERFLIDQELDSGILVGRGGNIEFWHRTFQEYLVASAIAARGEAEQETLLFTPTPRLYQPEWREVMPLLAGVLRQQGARKIELLFATLLRTLGPAAALPEEARCVGLMGVMLRDLAPYQDPPPAGDYPALLERVKAIFDPVKSASVPIRVRIEAADALGQVGASRFDPQSEEYWVKIPAGTFWMGSQSTDPAGRNFDPDARDDESPVHEVELGAYRIAKAPVTVAEYLKFVEDQGYTEVRWWTEGGYAEFTAPDEWDDQQQFPARPVVGVSWYEAMAYCAWAGFRLPTEAEWERAARGVEGRRYPWSRSGENDVPNAERTNYAPDGELNIGHPTPSGVYPQGGTPEGIQDLGGNVEQWCGDRYGMYSAEPVTIPVGAAKGSYRAIRGGAWADGYLRSGFRDFASQRDRNHCLGFRVA
ncbi:MAG: SUMF1/EgtB/PvdO family nonheme iron enzyme, partial [Planctomycetota bacterium]|nr:SUMF1/EgtB/PvdO family nonheme iron enzyme [Planctomycetota bacterium]